jgi:tetratricopeptide (TPR) repeat protein
MNDVPKALELDRTREGSLDERSLARLCATLALLSWTGSLTLTPPGGDPVVVLVRDGELGVAGDSDASRERLLEAFGWKSGTYQLDEAWPEEIFRTFGASNDLIFEGIQGHARVADLVRRSRQSLVSYPVPTNDAQERLASMGNPEPLTQLVARCDGDTRMATVMRHDFPDMGAKLKALFFAVETDLLFMSAAPGTQSVAIEYSNLRGTQDAPAPEEERRRTRPPTANLPPDATTPEAEEEVAKTLALFEEIGVDPGEARVPLITPEPPGADQSTERGLARSSRSDSEVRRSLPASGSIRKARTLKSQDELRTTRRELSKSAAVRAPSSAFLRARTAPESGTQRATRGPSSLGGRPTPASVAPERRAPAPLQNDTVAAQRSHIRGVKFMQAEQWSQALAEFSRAATQAPDIVSYKADVLWASYQNVPSKADFILENLLNLYDGVDGRAYEAERCRAEIQSCLGRIERAEGNIDHARDHLELALEHDPTNLAIQRAIEDLSHRPDKEEKGGLFARFLRKRSSDKRD